MLRILNVSLGFAHFDGGRIIMKEKGERSKYMESYKIDDFLILVMAQIFEVPEIIVKGEPDWFLNELTSLLEKIDVQYQLKKYMEREQWKNKRWYGEVEEEN
jgi:hypothetical protein